LVASFGSPDCWSGLSEYYVNLQVDQFGRESGKALVLSLGVTIFDGDVLFFDIFQLTQALPERLYVDRSGGTGAGKEEANQRHFRLLRFRRRGKHGHHYGKHKKNDGVPSDSPPGSAAHC
jgi:hypothetical protein